MSIAKCMTSKLFNVCDALIFWGMHSNKQHRNSPNISDAIFPTATDTIGGNVPAALRTCTVALRTFV